MKRFSFAAVLAAVLIGLSMVHGQPAKADPAFGYPGNYTLITDLNLIGLATQVNNPPSGTCTANFYGVFVGGLDIYTSVDTKFDDATKVGAEVTAPNATPIPIVLPASTTSTSGFAWVRIQNRAYTSGDPFAVIDCNGGAIVAPVAQPTPTATP